MRAALRAVVLVSSIVLLPIAARAQANPDPQAVGFELAWNHVALSVPNIAESIAWYEKMLGFKGTIRPGQPGARQQIADLRRGNITIELFQLPDAAPLPESRKNPSEDFRTHGVKHFGFEVKNLAAVLAELKAKGVKMAFEMRVTPTEDFAFISDNAGNAIELIEHKTKQTDETWASWKLPSRVCFGDSGGPTFFNAHPLTKPLNVSLVAVASDGGIDCIRPDYRARVDTAAVQQWIRDTIQQHTVPEH